MMQGYFEAINLSTLGNPAANLGKFQELPESCAAVAGEAL